MMNQQERDELRAQYQSELDEHQPNEIGVCVWCGDSPCNFAVVAGDIIKVLDAWEATL